MPNNPYVTYETGDSVIDSICYRESIDCTQDALGTNRSIASINNRIIAYLIKCMNKHDSVMTVAPDCFIVFPCVFEDRNN